MTQTNMCCRLSRRHKAFRLDNKNQNSIGSRSRFGLFTYQGRSSCDIPWFEGHKHHVGSEFCAETLRFWAGEAWPCWEQQWSSFKSDGDIWLLRSRICKNWQIHYPVWCLQLWSYFVRAHHWKKSHRQYKTGRRTKSNFLGKHYVHLCYLFFNVPVSEVKKVTGWTVTSTRDSWIELLQLSAI